MRVSPSQVTLIRGNLLPHSPLAAAVAYRAEQVAGLLVTRRRLAILYRRTQLEDQRVALETIDRELAKHNIDLPAIARLTNRPKACAPASPARCC